MPAALVPWLKRHFFVVFGGDYLDQGPVDAGRAAARFSPVLSYRISADPQTSLASLHCRLMDWVTGKPIWKEYRCRRLGPAASDTALAPQPRKDRNRASAVAMSLARTLRL